MSNKYYFLVNNFEHYIIGPFLDSNVTPNIYIGQIIRSNDFSKLCKLDNLEKLNLELYQINSDKNYLNIKTDIQIAFTNNNFNIINPTYLCIFDNLILESDIANKLFVTYEKNQYKLTFKIVSNIIMCPTLEILSI